MIAGAVKGLQPLEAVGVDDPHQIGHGHAVKVSGLGGLRRVDIRMGIDPDDSGLRLRAKDTADRPDGNAIIAHPSLM